MKLHNIKRILGVGLIVLATACQPIEDPDYLENSTDVDGVELVATQSTPGGNKIQLEMVSPGITGYWDYNIGQALTNRVEFVYPIPGTSTFTYVGTLGKEFFTKTIDVQIDVLDSPLEQDWYDLVSENTSEGKTWVFAGGPSPDGQRWWYMSPPNDPSAWESAWWNAAGDCCPPQDAAGKMKFDLDGAANFTYWANESASPQLAGFALDTENMTLQINGGNILGFEEPWGNPNGLYTIIELTEERMILYNPSNSGGTGWTWIFKPE
ncbi:hypothetical protein [Robertkochia solimangrovi]|uniref:hypothetical protein n=1 Tax=Robertkochia solimangrovi TaxID=2213046 RepID=UPI0011805A5A|nr:hypothetical protein [Robertkochia solimangrovi]TRZ45078.1 hypothetical protein DMZ48_04820 [Robertkochia solimangrovi]